jgi:hypothetical protein
MTRRSGISASTFLGLTLACHLGCSSRSGAQSDAAAGSPDASAVDASAADAGLSTDAGVTPDAGHALDAGPEDGGGTDGGTGDGGMSATCNAQFHAVLDPVKAGSVPPGATVVGVSNANEVLTIATGTTFSGDIYVFNQGNVVVAPGTAVTTLNGSVYLGDQGSFHADNTNLAVGQQYSGNYDVVAIDQSTYQIGQSSVSLGANPGIILAAILCGTAQLTATSDDFTVRGANFLDPFPGDQSSVTLSNDKGSFEVSLDNDAHATITGIASPSVVGTYFTLRGPLGTLPTLASGSAVTADIQFPPDATGGGMRANITSSNIFFGLWVEPGASFLLQNSIAALFLTFRGGVSTANGLHAGTFASGGLTLSDRIISFSNTTVPVLNAYETAPDTAAGQLTITASTLGEHNCHGPVGTRCVLETGTVVDGSGGSLRAEENAELDVIGTSWSTANVTTYVTAVQNSVIRLQDTALTGGTAQPSPWIDAFNASLVSLEDAVVGNGIPLRPHDTAAIAQAWIAAPSNGDTVSGSVVVGGIAAVATASTSSPNAFVSYSLTYNPAGTSNQTLITTSTTPVPAFNSLGTWNATGLPHGSYQLHLILTGASGTISEIVHTVMI